MLFSKKNMLLIFRQHIYASLLLSIGLLLCSCNDKTILITKKKVPSKYSLRPSSRLNITGELYLSKDGKYKQILKDKNGVYYEI